MAIKKINRDSKITVVTSAPAEPKLYPWTVSDDYVDFDVYMQDLRKIVVAIRRGDEVTVERERKALAKWRDELAAKGLTWHGALGEFSELCRLQEALLNGEPDSVERVTAWKPYQKFVEAVHSAWALWFCQGVEQQIASGILQSNDYVARSTFVTSVERDSSDFRRRVIEDGLNPNKFLDMAFGPNHAGLVYPPSVAEEARRAVGL